MDLFEYYEKAKIFAIFPSDISYTYLTLGLIGEMGEVSEKLKKVIRDHPDIYDNNPAEWPEDVKRGIMLELGDVCWYAAMYLAFRLNEDFDKDLLNIQYISAKSISMCQDRWTFSIFNHIQPALRRLTSLIRIEDGNFLVETSGLLSEIFAIARKLGYQPEDVLQMNIDKLTSRFQRGAGHGDGDYR